MRSIIPPDSLSPDGASRGPYAIDRAHTARATSLAAATRNGRPPALLVSAQLMRAARSSTRCPGAPASIHVGAPLTRIVRDGPTRRPTLLQAPAQRVHRKSPELSYRGPISQSSPHRVLRGPYPGGVWRAADSDLPVFCPVVTPRCSNGDIADTIDEHRGGRAGAFAATRQQLSRYCQPSAGCPDCGQSNLRRRQRRPAACLVHGSALIGPRTDEIGARVRIVVTPIDHIEHEVCVHRLDVALVEYVQPRELAGEAGADDRRRRLSLIVPWG